MANNVSQYMTWQYPGHFGAYLSEFFAQVSRCENDDKKVNMMIEFLRTIQNNPRKVSTLRIALACLFNDNYVFDLPPGMPEGVKCERLPDKVAGSLYKTLMSVNYFLTTSTSKIPNVKKRELVFIQYLESMHEGDAHAFVALKDKDVKFFGITQEIAYRAFPGWVAAPTTSTPVVAFKKAVVEAVKPKKEATQDVADKPKKKQGRPKKTPPLV